MYVGIFTDCVTAIIKHYGCTNGCVVPFCCGCHWIIFYPQTDKRLPHWTVLRLRHWLLILLGIVGLSANFFLYNVALQYIPPTTSQVFSPLSSFGMLLVGVLLFKETFAVYQKVGLGLLILGLILFLISAWKTFYSLALM